MLDDLRAHGMDSAVSVNGFVRHHEPLLGLSDARGFPIFSSMVQGELNEQWWNRSSWDAAAAESIIGPLADRIRFHPSLVGVNYIDDAPQSKLEAMRLAQQVFDRRAMPASPTMGGGSYARTIYDYVHPSRFLFYVYPKREKYTSCAQWVPDWLALIRNATASNTVPPYIGLQTHQTLFGPSGTKLVYPTVEEIRLQAWIALGEGMKALWWFHYDDNPSGEWIGFRNQPATYAEITDLARRIASTEGTLGSLRKLADSYDASGGYVSTMSANGATYLVVANESCAPQDLVLTPGTSVRDTESGVVYGPGQPIPFRGGDGRLFEVVPG